MSRGGNIEAVVTGPKQYAADLDQGRLDIPCWFTFTGGKNPSMIKKLKNKLTLYLML